MNKLLELEQELKQNINSPLTALSICMRGNVNDSTRTSVKIPLAPTRPNTFTTLAGEVGGSIPLIQINITKSLNNKKTCLLNNQFIEFIFIWK